MLIRLPRTVAGGLWNGLPPPLLAILNNTQNNYSMIVISQNRVTVILSPFLILSLCEILKNLFP
jgi:hypothetical protein